MWRETLRRAASGVTMVGANHILRGPEAMQTMLYRLLMDAIPVVAVINFRIILAGDSMTSSADDYGTNGANR